MAQRRETIQLRNTSRYRNTQVFRDDFTFRRVTGPPVEEVTKNIIFYGTWRPPEIFENKPPTIHLVQADEIIRPDLIATRVYGDKDFFWAIALRNNIFNALTDIQAGTRLVCPHIEDVLIALAESSDLGSEVVV